MTFVTAPFQGGSLRGVVDGESESFRGIVYAQPPVGALRFRPPVSAAPIIGEVDATAFGPIAPQSVDELDAVMGASHQVQSEAGCLTLNVWRPLGTDPDAALPVLVWVHGGALVGGSSSWEQYSGASFARDGVIMVGVNYRLGPFGFIDWGDGPNLGLRDVTLALEWVRDSIASLGGDADRVTIFGESAGGALCSALVVSPPAAGLFRRAIIQSGIAAVLLEPEAAARIATNAHAALGVDPGDRAALEAVPVEVLLALRDDDLMSGVTGPATFPWLPVRDAETLDLTAIEGVAAGRADDVELVLGWTVDEYRLRWLVQQPDGPAVPLSRVSADFERRASALYSRLLPHLGRDELEEKVANDQHYLAPALAVVNAQLARGGSPRLYEFAWRSPVRGGLVGACHALELPFVFDRLVAPGFHGDAPPAQLVDAMHGAWIELARGGSPWPAFSADEPNVAVFDSTSSVDTDYSPAVLALWRSAPTEWIGIA